jgi:crotonobetainyl-CoA:carnitine CoA-transferase CaiB-like acyl-CoA transferase
MVDVDCREAGQVKLIGTPVRLGEERPDINLPPPRLGEHNREIYCGLLGYSERDLARLKEEGII